jgi:hypothetical protein
MRYGAICARPERRSAPKIDAASARATGGMAGWREGGRAGGRECALEPCGALKKGRTSRGAEKGSQ